MNKFYIAYSNSLNEDQLLVGPYDYREDADEARDLESQRENNRKYHYSHIIERES